jgi:hypothetical protein
VLELTGNLKEEFGGVPIVGEDVVKTLMGGSCGRGYELALLLPVLMVLHRRKRRRPA